MNPAHLHDLDPARLRRRKGAKWGRYGPDVLPAWVADMDFPPPAAVQAVLHESVGLADLGYAAEADRIEFIEALRAWLERQHGWAPAAEAIMPVTDVMQGVALGVTQLSHPGDGILLQTPAYTPFFRLIDESHRQLISHPLTADWQVDLASLDRCASRSRVLLLCNPHNPAGRVFSDDELAALGAAVVEHDLVVVADEIWADLVLPPHRHVSLGTLGRELTDRSVIATSASKTFGLPGLTAGAVIATNPDVMARLESVPFALTGHPSALGLRAMAAAWRTGDQWLAETIAYVAANRDHAITRLTTELPGVRTTIPEATYLLWVDCRALGLPEEPSRIALKEGGVALGRGPDYGEEGRGFVRLNLGTSRPILDAIIDRFVRAVSRRTPPSPRRRRSRG